jgi:hypothetical protein
LERIVTALYLILGTAFGFVLSRSGAADYNYIQGMFLFTEFQLYGIIGVGVVLTAPGLWLIKRHGRTLLGQPIKIELKGRNRGNVLGGVLFGIGWSLAGMCPGTDLREYRRRQDLRAGRARGRPHRRGTLRRDLRAPARRVRAPDTERT